MASLLDISNKPTAATTAATKTFVRRKQAHTSGEPSGEAPCTPLSQQDCATPLSGVPSTSSSSAATNVESELRSRTTARSSILHRGRRSSILCAAAVPGHESYREAPASRSLLLQKMPKARRKEYLAYTKQMAEYFAEVDEFELVEESPGVATQVKARPRATAHKLEDAVQLQFTHQPTPATPADKGSKQLDSSAHAASELLCQTPCSQHSNRRSSLAADDTPLVQHQLSAAAAQSTLHTTSNGHVHSPPAFRVAAGGQELVSSAACYESASHASAGRAANMDLLADTPLEAKQKAEEQEMVHGLQQQQQQQLVCVATSSSPCSHNISELEAASTLFADTPAQAELMRCVDPVDREVSATEAGPPVQGLQQGEASTADSHSLASYTPGYTAASTDAAEVQQQTPAGGEAGAISESQLSAPLTNASASAAAAAAVDCGPDSSSIVQQMQQLAVQDDTAPAVVRSSGSCSPQQQQQQQEVVDLKPVTAINGQPAQATEQSHDSQDPVKKQQVHQLREPSARQQQRKQRQQELQQQQQEGDHLKQQLQQLQLRTQYQHQPVCLQPEEPGHQPVDPQMQQQLLQQLSADAAAQQLAELQLAVAAAAQFTPLQRMLQACGQPVDLDQMPCMRDFLLDVTDLKEIIKLGEGTYGEAFKAPSSGIVFKLVPMEGDNLINGYEQKKAGDLLTEAIIASTLSALAEEADPLGQPYPSHTNAFVKTHKVGVCRGPFPQPFIKAWKAWDKRNKSENDPIADHPKDQLYAIFAMADCGKDLEGYQLRGFDQARSMMLQVAVALAIAEDSLAFEHRDLHWGNVMLTPAPTTHITCRYRGCTLKVRTEGAVVSLIDFTASRLQTPAGDVVFCDLEAEEGLFDGPKGKPQFETYRRMRKLTKGDWSGSYPGTNIVWMLYLTELLLSSDKPIPGATAGQKQRLREFKKRVTKYSCCGDVIWDELFNGLWSAV